MNAHQPLRSDDEWLPADQPGPPLTALVRQRRGLVLGALMALAIAVVLVAQRPGGPPLASAHP